MRVKCSKNRQKKREQSFFNTGFFHFWLHDDSLLKLMSALKTAVLWSNMLAYLLEAVLSQEIKVPSGPDCCASQHRFCAVPKLFDLKFVVLPSRHTPWRDKYFWSGRGNNCWLQWLIVNKISSFSHFWQFMHCTERDHYDNFEAK